MSQKKSAVPTPNRSATSKRDGIPFDETASQPRIDRAAFGVKARPAPQVTAQPEVAGEADVLHVQPATGLWLHAKWELTARTIERARAALNRPHQPLQWVLRIHRVERDETGPRCRVHHADLSVDVDAREWYFPVTTNEDAWVVDLGVTDGSERFFSVMHCVPVMLPARNVGSSNGPAPASPSLGWRGRATGQLEISIAAQLVLRGQASPGATLQIDDHEIAVHPQSGEFETKFALEPGRAMFPVHVALGGDTRRGLVAVDLNVRLLDPPAREDH